LHICVDSGVAYEPNNYELSIDRFLDCIEDNSFRRYRRLHSPSDSNNLPGTPFILVVSVSVDDYLAVLNCSTREQVSHLKLDWYFQTRASSKPPRVIWQRGHSNDPRYSAYSPDQVQHYLQIKPVNYNDSGTYMCVDQTSGFSNQIELLVRKFNCPSLHYIIHSSSFCCAHLRETSMAAFLLLHQELSVSLAEI
jgi:hypothetical protein